MLFFVANLSNIDDFRTKQLTRLLEFTKLYKTKPLEKIVISTIFQNYTLALIIRFVLFQLLLPMIFFSSNKNEEN